MAESTVHPEVINHFAELPGKRRFRQIEFWGNKVTQIRLFR
jgi:hypothetical protein